MSWRWFAATLVASLGMAIGAQAAETLAYGAPPAWVKPLTLEPTATVVGASGGVAILLEDQEIRYGADYDETYEEVAIKALSPAGLNALGTITRSWNPATTAVTINRLELIRGGQVIDALAPNSPAGSDPFLVLRRETNLSLATLDGALTATKQLNGLQVGDIVHMAVTERVHDPLLGGLTQGYTSLNGPVGHAQVRLLWPRDKPVRWKATEGFGDPKITPTAEGTELLLDRRDLKPLIAPAGAPIRFGYLGMLQISQLADWQAISRLFAPLYDKASTLSADSPLKAEAQKIRAANPTKAGQAAAALKLVQDQIRYVALAMGDGGLNPAAADQTWSRRFGDCKGKTVVLLALLRELGIEAQPALVSASGADGLDQLLPAVSPFDHVMVRAVVDGRGYWLDGTRQGDGALAALPVPDMDWALPLSVAGTGLERLVVPLPTEAQEAQLLTIDLSGGKADKLPARLDYALRGDAALSVRQTLAEMDPTLTESTLKAVLKDRVNLDYAKAGVTDQDGVVTLHGEGMIEASWYTDSASRRPALALGGDSFGYFDLPDRSQSVTPDAPLALDYPNFQSSRMVVLLPGDGAGFTTSGADSDITAGGVRITRTTRTVGRTVTIDQTTRTLQAEASLADAKAANARFKAAPTDDAVVLLAPRDFTVTAAQLAATVAADPTNTTALVELGVKALEQGRYAEAIRQYDAAIKAQPGLARAWRAKAWAEMRLGQYDAALADADKGMSLDPQEPYGPYYRGLVYAAKGDYDKAVDDYNAALRLNPTMTEILVSRATALVRLKRYDAAQADVDAGLKFDPENSDLRAVGVDVLLGARPPGPLPPGYLTAAIRKAYAGVTSYDGLSSRGTLLLGLADAAEDGLSDLAAAIRLDPDRPEAYRVRGPYYMTHNRVADGTRDLDKAVALSPTLGSYLIRGQARLTAKDYAGARADFESAAAKDPNALDPGLYLSRLAQVQGDKAAALSELDKLIAAHPDQTEPYRRQAQIYVADKNYTQAGRVLDKALTVRPDDLTLASMASSAYEQAHDYERAMAITDKAIGLHPNNATLLNGRCYLKAEANIQLDTALADCDAAVKLSPNSAAILDSRGMVHLRRGEWDLAIADYDAALKLEPILAESSYGRAIARARKGDAAGSRADIADATRAAPDIAKTFADMGLKP